MSVHRMDRGQGAGETVHGNTRNDDGASEARRAGRHAPHGGPQAFPEIPQDCVPPGNRGRRLAFPQAVSAGSVHQHIKA